MSSVATPTNRPFRPLSWLTFGISVMDRYIVTELIPPFVFGVGAFSSIGVAIGVLFDLVRRITEAGLPLTLAVQIFFLKLPYYLSLAFPMAILLSCLMVYGRLSGDSELIALRSCGISIYRLVAPAVIAGLVMTGVTFAFNEAIVPVANRQATVTMQRALNGRDAKFREKNIFYQEFSKVPSARGDSEKVLSRIFYAKEFDGKQMKDLNILDFSQNGLDQIISAKSAVWNADEKTWDFFNGTIYVINSDGSYRNILRFDRQQIQLPRTPLDIAESTTDPIEMNIAEIRNYLAAVGDSAEDREIRKLQLRIEQKISFPFACLLFSLMGSTLGIRPQRSGRRATGFGISLILILCYYLFTSICEAFYQFGILPVVLAAWLPTLIGFAAGIFLLNRLNQ